MPANLRNQLQSALFTEPMETCCIRWHLSEKNTVQKTMSLNNLAGLNQSCSVNRPKCKRRRHMLLRKSVFVVTCSAALVGCSITTEDAMQAPPRLELTSGKPAKTVGICIADRWEADFKGSGQHNLSARETGAGYRVSWSTGPITLAVADVRNTTAGSTTSLHIMRDNSPRTWFHPGVQDCQK